MQRECSICGEPDSNDILVAGLTLYPEILLCDETQCLDAVIAIYPGIVSD